jgi:putative molybdopterin biosynthesis protein
MQSAASPHYCASAIGRHGYKRLKFHSEASDASPVTLGSSDYIRVDTGDELPQGCDSVVMIEMLLSMTTAGFPFISGSAMAECTADRRNICMGRYDNASFTKNHTSIIGALLEGGVFSS